MNTTSKALRQPTQEELFRRENLRFLIREEGGPGGLAAKLGHTNPSFLSQLAGPRPSRHVSEKVAREIETKLGFIYKWLDEPRTRIQYAPKKASPPVLQDREPPSTVLRVTEPELTYDLAANIAQPEKNTSLEKINEQRLTACIEKILSKKIKAKPSSLSKMIMVLYGSNASVDQFDTMSDLLVQVMINYNAPPTE